MRTLGIRELRERSATFIKRAGAGEQMIITVSGEPVATLGPLTPLENSNCFFDGPHQQWFSHCIAATRQVPITSCRHDS